MLQPNKQQEILALVTRLVQGTHDSTPTRMLPPLDNKSAWQIDEWWQAYFLSAHNARRADAQRLLELLKNE